MIDRAKKIFTSETGRNFLIYSFGALFLKGISFLLIPLYTRILPPSVYGNLDLLNTFSGILDVFFSMGLVQVVFIEFLHLEREERLKMVNRVISLYVTVSTFLYVAMFVIAAGKFLDILSGVNNLMIAMSFATTYLLFFQGMLLSILRLSGKAMRATIFQVVLGCITIGLNLLLVYYLKMGITGILVTGLTVAVLSALYAYVLFRQYGFTFFYSFEPEVIRKYLKLSLPFIPGALSIWFMYSANRWILLNYTNVDEVGIFSVATRFGSVFDQLMIQPFLNAYVPVIMARLRNRDTSSPIIRVSLGSLIVFGIIGTLMSLFGKWFIGPSYHSALPVIPVLAIASAFSLIAQATAVQLVFQKKSMYLLYAVIIGSIASVGGNFLFVERFGSMGAAFGNLSGNLIWATMIAVFTFILTKKNETPAVS
jgi:O-antigen/teichoic acid export membrane protein